MQYSSEAGMSLEALLLLSSKELAVVGFGRGRHSLALSRAAGAGALSECCNPTGRARQGPVHGVTGLPSWLPGVALYHAPPLNLYLPESVWPVVIDVGRCPHTVTVRTCCFMWAATLAATAEPATRSNWVRGGSGTRICLSRSVRIHCRLGSDSSSNISGKCCYFNSCVKLSRCCC